MKVSVIVPCFNAGKTVAMQLESLAKQNWTEPWEVIVSDNGSTDDTLLVVESYRNRIPHLRITDSSQRRGCAHARNIGASIARGESVVFCDADDEIAPGWVAAMGNALSLHEFVACRIDIDKLNPPWSIKHFRHPQTRGIMEYDYPPFLPHAGGGTIGIRKWLFDSLGGFDASLKYLEDTDLCWRVQLSGVSLTFVPEAVLHCRHRKTLRGIFRQSFIWGEYNVLMYKTYLPYGMAKLSRMTGIMHLFTLLKEPFTGKLRDKGDLAWWLWRFGWSTGRLRGSIKYHVFAL